MEEAWPRLDLSVQIATKLNRNHLFPGKVTYLLPCLGRIEEDVQASGPQAVSMEDSTSCIHGSRGRARPASPLLLSEPAIVASIAKQISPANPSSTGTAGSPTMRASATRSSNLSANLQDFNERLFTPGGFWKGNKAAERIWQTPSKKAEFLAPTDDSRQPGSPMPRGCSG
jgi:hypothetical protein